MWDHQVTQEINLLKIIIMSISEHIIVGTSYNSEEWIIYGRNFVKALLKICTQLILDLTTIVQENVIFHGIEQLKKIGKECYTISNIDPRNEKERRNKS